MRRLLVRYGLATSLPLLAGMTACGGVDGSSSRSRALEGPPTDLSAATTDEGEVVLTWRAPAGAETYRVKVAAERGYQTIADGIGATRYTHVPAGRTTYVVTAIAGGRESAPSNPVSAGVDPNRRGGEPTPEAREERGAVGSIDASFDVNANGAATYTVPIKVPPGVRGVEPRLSLAYSSQGEDSGLLGVGFQLSGLSRIERCPRTVAADGVAGTVTLTRTDRLCLDGMRLVKVAGFDDYMADRSVYHTQNETWTKVEAEGQCDLPLVPPSGTVAIAAGGPCSFKATLKNGTVVRYGESAQAACSRVTPPAGSPRVDWPITSITDLNGNKMVIEYQATGERQCIPTAMKYTSNSAADSGHQREVRFVYEGRALTVTRWLGGFQRTLDKRLARLETWVLGSQYPSGETMAKQYRLEYQVSPTTGREVVKRLLECDGSTCLPSTDFTPIADPDLFPGSMYVATTQRIPQIAADGIWAGDFNGDGKLDYITGEVLPGGPPDDPSDVLYQLSLSLPGRAPDLGFEQSAWQDREQWETYNGMEMHATDVNADGYTDLIQLMRPCTDDEAVVGGARVYLGSPSGLASTPAALVSQFSQEDDIQVGDFDGDGRGDVLATARRSSLFCSHPEYDGWRLFKWDGSNFALAASGSFGPEPEWNDFTDDEQSLTLHRADFNGDGKVDFLVTKRVFDLGNSHTRWRLFLADGTSFVQQPESGVWPHYLYDIAVGDMNGDGYSDLLLTGRIEDWFSGDHYDGHMIVQSTGRTLRPVIVNPQTFTRDVDGQTITIPWGTTGALPGRCERVDVVNFNGDDKDDVLTTPDQGDYNCDGAMPGKHVFLSRDGASLIQTLELGGDDDEVPHLIGDFDEDGVDDVLQTFLNGETYAMFGGKNDSIERVVDGIGQVIEVRYGSMLDPGTYEMGSGAVYPVREYVSGRRLVERVTRYQLDSLEQKQESSYNYRQARTDLEGRGFLGFAEVEMRDETQFVSLTSKYRQDYPFGGLLVEQVQASTGAGTCPLRGTVFTYEDGATGFPTHGVRLKSRSEREYLECDVGLESHRRTLTYTYDAYGSIELLDDQAPGSLLRTAKTYKDDPVAWRLGYPLTEDVSDGATTLGKKKLDYDGSLNLTFEGSWDEEHQTWLGVTQIYNAHGNPISSTDPRSGVTTFLYDGYQLAAGTVDQLGHVRGQKLDPRFGAEVERSDPNGNKTWLTLDGYGRTTSVSQTSPQGQVVEVQRFELTRDPEHVKTGFVSQAFSRRSWTTAEWDWKEEFRDGFGRLYRTRSRGGYDDKPIRVDYEYDAMKHDRVSRASQPYREGDSPLFTRYLYDDRKRVTRAILADDAELVTEYLDADRKVKRSDPLGSSTTQTLDGRGNVIALVDPKGHTTSMSHDALGRLTLTTRPGGETTSVVYDGLGRTKQVTTSVGGTTRYAYDDTGHLTDETDGKGQRIVRTYDALDRTLTKQYLDSHGQLERESTFEYDDPALMNSKGQLSHVTVRGPGGAVESSYDFAYDRYGHQADAWLSIDGQDFHWSAEHDPSGRLVRSVYPDGADVRTELTPAGHVARVVLHEAGAPQGSETVYARYAGHDPNGNPAQLRQSNGVTTCYEYQPLTGLLSGLRTFHTGLPDPIPCGQAPADAKPLLDYSYQWTEVYNLERIEDHLTPSRTQAFTYNARGELASATSAGLYGTVQYGDYGAANQLLRNGAEQFTYSGAPGKGAQLASSSQGLAVTYDATGNMETKTRGADAWVYTWDVADRLTRVDKNGATQAAFVYDEDGHRLKKVDASGTTYYVSSQYEVFVPAGGGAPRHTKYVRGPAGVLAQITATGVTLASLVRAEADRGLAAMIDTGTFAGVMAGVRHGLFLRVDPAAVARWLGRGVLGGAVAALAVLLVLGVRRRRSGPARDRRPGLAALAAATALAVLATYGVSPGVARAAMTPGPSGAGVPADGVFHFHTNHLGSSSVVTDAAGAEVTRIEYDAFGRLLPASTGVDASRPKFTGKELDQTGLYYHGARYYDPELGAFISPDTQLGGDPSKSASFNRYAYALNNPITLTDPSGHYVLEVLFVIGVAVAATIGFLAAGTEGKIFTDPGDAFDDFSWTKALMGAWVGLVTACLSFTLGSYASTTLMASPAMEGALDLALGAASNALLSVAAEYAQGQRDADALFATFGSAFVAGFVSGASSSLAGLASKVAAQSKYFAQVARGLITSGMKKLISPHEPYSLTLSLWYVELTVSEDDPLQLSIDGRGVLAEAESIAGQQLESWARASGPEWDWATRSIQAVKSLPDRVGLGYLGSVRDLAMMRHGSLYGVARTALLANPYLASHQQTVATWLDQNQISRHIREGLDTARAFPWRLVEEEILR